eukprot:CAMPEP_0117556256 /NCGR_PEP_ID=MMETSP0784-20121206/51710_1 /TAXON_ID=39447 /ORGANISM="" /LENGTH=71 /DNA_ID=CAMNT_0005353515 /DNA_START=115 /DNA_END=327 /DNA_ORIENTATION=+
MTRSTPPHAAEGPRRARLFDKASRCEGRGAKRRCHRQHHPLMSPSEGRHDWKARATHEHPCNWQQQIRWRL